MKEDFSLETASLDAGFFMTASTNSWCTSTPKSCSWTSSARKEVQLFSRHLFIAGDGDRLHEELVVPVVTRPAHIALLRLLQDDLDLLTLARLERAIGRAHLELFLVLCSST